MTPAAAKHSARRTRAPAEFGCPVSDRRVTVGGFTRDGVPVVPFAPASSPLWDLDENGHPIPPASARTSTAAAGYEARRAAIIRREHEARLSELRARQDRLARDLDCTVGAARAALIRELNASHAAIAREQEARP